MDLRVPGWVTNFLGFQSVASFGAQPQVQLQNFEGPAVECALFQSAVPQGFESTSLAVVTNNLAVVPTDWISSGIAKPWFTIESHPSFVECMSTFKKASFVAFNDDFLDVIGRDAKLEMIYEFSAADAQRVHEAPVYVPTTNELVFADTSVIGWLWALNIDSKKMRKINTSPPLENVNGGTMRGSKIYLATNGGRAPAIWSCTMPTGTPPSGATETINCTPIVNNYHLNHLNSPNDLVFTSSSNILFTDPLYGWQQGWPGVGAPELPTGTYHFNTKTGALVTLENESLQPNGLALSMDEKTFYLADSNSTSGKPIGAWEDSIRNVYAFDFDEATLTLRNRRLVHVVESAWPDGIRISKFRKAGKDREILLVATVGGIDVLDVSGGGAGVFLGKWNVGEDLIFNLEPAVKGGCESKARFGAGTWLATGRKGVYKITIVSVS